MNLKHLKDKELLQKTQQLVQNERQVLTQVLHHLKEVDRRKLFSELGHQSLFAYCIRELQYSEGQASRRIQAMRLVKELPEIEKKIESGTLSLSNLSRAQSYFREKKKQEDQKRIPPSHKLEVLEKLENKSAREGEKILLKLQPEQSLPKEKERTLTETHTEIRFIMTQGLKSQLEELRSLFGPRGVSMSFSELIHSMTQLSLETLRAKKFGKKRSQANKGVNLNEPNSKHKEEDTISTSTTSQCKEGNFQVIDKKRVNNSFTQQLRQSAKLCSKNPRAVSKALRYQVWKRDQRQCVQCGSQRNLNLDHIQPLALGGETSLENLRLLCFHCNQRQAIKSFGIETMEKYK